MRRASDRRIRDRRAGRPVFYPVRYADDFLIFVTGSYDDAVAERQALADWLREEMGLTLSEQKTRITALTEGFRFLGCRVRLKWDDRFGYGCRVEVPKEVVNDFRRRVKNMLRRQTQVRSLQSMLRELNPILRGWAGYYRYCIGAKRTLSSLDWYVRGRLWLWVRGKHKRVPTRKLTTVWRRDSRAHPGTRVWAAGSVEQYLMAYIRVTRFELRWMRSPAFAKTFGEPDALRKVHVRFGERTLETCGSRGRKALASYSTASLRGRRTGRRSLREIDGAAGRGRQGRSGGAED